MVLGLLGCSDLQGSLTCENFFRAIFEFIGQEAQEVFSVLGIRVFLENGLGSLRRYD
jgi:hypothetical protein